jgi:hypothetical protein
LGNLIFEKLLISDINYDTTVVVNRLKFLKVDGIGSESRILSLGGKVNYLLAMEKGKQKLARRHGLPVAWSGAGCLAADQGQGLHGGL